MCILEADGEQIEGRQCFVLTKDPELIKLARLRSSEFDQHKLVASILPRLAGTYFGYPEHEIPGKSDERQVAKSINHSAQGGVQAKTAQETLLKHDERFAFSEEVVDAMLEAYHKRFPGVRAFHARIRKEIRSNHALTTSFGHVWDVRYEETNDDLYRRAYRWKLQRYCAWVTNTLGLIPLWYWLTRENMASRIMLQEHDSLVCSCPVSEVYDVACFMKSHMEAPQNYEGVELSIPVSFKLGRNWGDTYEFGELPDRHTFEAKAIEYTNAG